MLHLNKLRTAILVMASLAAMTTVAQAATRIRWYGQSAFKVATPSGGVILIDPWLTAPSNPDKASIAKHSLGSRVIEMKPGEDRAF
jgi:L-ascorbate metabolism protein UlaG (beta-lactamase superfamily)